MTRLGVEPADDPTDLGGHGRLEHPVARHDVPQVASRHRLHLELAGVGVPAYVARQVGRVAGHRPRTTS